MSKAHLLVYPAHIVFCKCGFVVFIAIEGLSSMAENLLSIDNLDTQPDTKQALIEAYNLGRLDK